MKPLVHAKNSVKKHGGVIDDYIDIHSWFDESKAYYADYRHRALRHHSYGIFQCEEEFGLYITNSEGKHIAVRELGEQHVTDDLGCIPSVQDWLSCIDHRDWMSRFVKEE